jgi:sugar phosphate isomerase/epimerase
VSLEKYVKTVFERAEKAKVEVVVFGSGGARSIPDGFDRERGLAQIMAFCRMIGPVAQEHGVVVAVEPLNRNECNVINSVAECAEIVRRVNHPAVRLLVDAFHWLKENDSADDIIGNGEFLAHVHAATISSRLAPGSEPCDLSVFFSALERAAYDGRISIEGGVPNPCEDLPRALELMKSE